MLNALCFFLGVLWLQLWPALPDAQWLWGLGCVGLLLWWLPFRFGTGVTVVASLGAGLLGLAYAGLMAQQALTKALPETLESHNLLIEGRVLGLPQQSNDRIRFEFQIESAHKDNERQSLQGKVRLSWVGKDRQQLRAGERWRLLVRLKAPHGFANPGGFVYEDWMWREGLMARGYVRKDTQNQRLPDAVTGLAPLDAGRQRVSERLTAAIDGPARALVAALTLGDRSGFNQADWGTFRDTGTNHLVAISGLHIGMVAGLLLVVVGWLWRRSQRLCLWLPALRAASLLAILGALFYAAMAGFAIPTQRALIMLAAILLPLLLGRQARPWRGLGLALVLVLLIEPRAALAPGFLLSFAAVASILWALGTPEARRGFWASLWRMQLAASLIVSPLVILLFNQATWLGFPVNLLAVPWFSFVLVPLAFIGVSLLLLAPSLGGWLLQQVAPLYDWTLQALAWTATQAPGVWYLADRPVLVILLAALGGVWLLAPLRLPARGLAILLFVPMLGWRVPSLAEGALGITMLDVGQGLSVVVQTRNHLLLYDTGPQWSEDFDAGQAVVLPFLRSQGLSRIDRLLISHPALDHAGGLASILAAMPVTEVLGPELPPSLNPAQPWPRRDCRAGEAWRWDGVDFEILHPENAKDWNDNDSSCVLLVRNAAGALLLLGDLERPGEEALLKTHGTKLRGVLVQVGHHGSKTSSSPAFVEHLRSPLALISSGYKNRFRFPAPSIVKRWQASGTEVVNTSELGAMSLVIDPQGVRTKVQGYRQRDLRFWR